MADRERDVADRAAERKRAERERRRRDGWNYVTVALPPGAEIEVKRLAAQRRVEHLETQS